MESLLGKWSWYDIFKAAKLAAEKVPVMGNIDEEVVYLMCAYVVHKLVCPSIVAIHWAEVAPDKVPLLINIPG